MVYFGLLALILTPGPQYQDSPYFSAYTMRNWTFLAKLLSRLIKVKISINNIKPVFHGIGFCVLHLGYSSG